MAASSSQERNITTAGASNLAMMEKLNTLLVEYGTELLKPCDCMEELLRKLDNLEHVLLHITQDLKKLVALALQPSKEALIANELIRHAELDVRVSVASCISEIIRITAPDEPYEDEQMKEYFLLANSAFESLSFMSGRTYSKAVSILGTISYSQSCVVMLDLQLYDIVHQMFHLFLNGIRTSHSQLIFSSMVNIMTVIIHNNIDNDEFSLELAKILLTRLKKENQDVSPVAFQLAEDTFKNCTNDLKSYLPEAARCLGIPVEDYAEVVASLFRNATQRENMDSNDTGAGASCHGEATGLAVNDTKCENRKTNDNLNENQLATSHFCDEPEKLGSPRQQEDSEDIRVDASFHGEARLAADLHNLAEGINSGNLETHASLNENQMTTSQFCDEPEKLGSPIQQEDSGDIVVGASCNGQAGLAVNDALPNLAEGSKDENMKTYDNLNENQMRTSHFCDEPEKLGSPRQQEDSKPKDVLISKKRCRKPNSLMKLEEGYDPLWMLGNWTSMKESCYRPAGEPSSGPISQTTNRIKKRHIKRQESTMKMPLEVKRRGKTTFSEDLRRDINVKTLPSQPRPASSNGEALSDEVSIFRDKGKSTASKDKDSKVKYASKCFGEEVVGCRIKVWWPLDEMFYEGKITSFNQLSKIHRVDYDDGDQEKLDLGKECWQLIGNDDLSIQEQKTDATSDASTETLSDHGRKYSRLSKKKKEIWEQMMS